MITLNGWVGMAWVTGLTINATWNKKRFGKPQLPLCAVKNSTWLRINMVQDKYKAEFESITGKCQNGLWWLRWGVSVLPLVWAIVCLQKLAFLKMADESLYILCGMIQYTGFKFYLFLIIYQMNLSELWNSGETETQGCCRTECRVDTTSNWT